MSGSRTTGCANCHDPLPIRPRSRSSGRSRTERFRELPIEPNPLYRGYGYFTGVDLTEIDPAALGPALDLPPGLPGSIRIVHDASGTRVTLPRELADAGLRVETLHDLWASADGELSSFVRGLEVAPDRLSALATTLLNRGYRLEVPGASASPSECRSSGSSPGRTRRCRSAGRSAGEDAQLLFTEEVYSTPGKHDEQRLWASSTDLDLADRAKVVFLSVHAPDLRTVSIYRRSATTGAGSRRRLALERPRRIPNQDAEPDHALGERLRDGRPADVLRGEEPVLRQLGRRDPRRDRHPRPVDHARGIHRRGARDEPGSRPDRAGARRTIAYVSEHAMLLSRGARSDTIPILEILCRDVKATHSTSVAPVDPEKVFYLESRGMAAPDAIRMIGEGYLSYVLERAPVGRIAGAALPDPRGPLGRGGDPLAGGRVPRPSAAHGDRDRGRARVAIRYQAALTQGTQPMALVMDPTHFTEESLAQLVLALRRDLEETRDLIRNPRGRILDPASLRSAEELIEATLAILDGPGPRDRGEQAREANLTYAAMVTAIDLMKSHTEVPKVPAPRPSPKP